MDRGRFRNPMTEDAIRERLVTRRAFENPVYRIAALAAAQQGADTVDKLSRKLKQELPRLIADLAVDVEAENRGEAAYPQGVGPIPAWIARMSDADELRIKLAQTVEQKNRMRSRAERAEGLLASVRTIFPALKRAVYGEPEPTEDDEL